MTFDEIRSTTSEKLTDIRDKINLELERRDSLQTRVEAVNEMLHDLFGDFTNEELKKISIVDGLDGELLAECKSLTGVGEDDYSSPQIILKDDIW